MGLAIMMMNLIYNNILILEHYEFGEPLHSIEMNYIFLPNK
jgi:hypothetical protein